MQEDPGQVTSAGNSGPVSKAFTDLTVPRNPCDLCVAQSARPSPHHNPGQWPSWHCSSASPWHRGLGTPQPHWPEQGAARERGTELHASSGWPGPRADTAQPLAGLTGTCETLSSPSLPHEGKLAGAHCPSGAGPGLSPPPPPSAQAEECNALGRPSHRQAQPRHLLCRASRCAASDAQAQNPRRLQDHLVSGPPGAPSCPTHLPASGCT